MHKGKHKAQSAMEYILNYSWAIILIIIVFIALWALGVFDLGSSTVPRTTGTSRQKPIDASLLLDGSCSNTAVCVEVDVVNGEPGLIVFNTAPNATVNGNSNIAGCTIDGIDPGVTTVTIRQGQKYSLSCLGMAGAPSIEEGEAAESEIILSYSAVIAGSSISRTEIIQARGPVTGAYGG